MLNYSDCIIVTKERLHMPQMKAGRIFFLKHFEQKASRKSGGFLYLTVLVYDTTLATNKLLLQFLILS